MIDVKRSGEHRVQVIRDGVCIHDTGLFNNMLLDGYFSRLNNGSATAFTSGDSCMVGTGSKTVDPSDTALSSFIAINATPSNTSSYDGRSGGFFKYSIKRVFSFPFGSVIGNISEIGTLILRSGNQSTPLDTRVLLPSTVTVTASDQLIVTHVKHVWISELDSAGALTLDGNNYNFLIRPINASESSVKDYVLSEGNWAMSGVKPQQWGSFNFSSATLPSAGGTLSGVVGVKEQTPTVTVISPPSTLVGRLDIIWQASQANHAAGINGFVMIGTYSVNIHMFVCQFTPNIPKTASQRLTLNLQITHSRL